MKSQNKILIVGGYGQVGGRIAAELAPLYPGQVHVAGRDLQKAGKLAEQLGNDVRPKRLDVNEPAAVDAALREVGLIINCIDLSDPHLLRVALAHGLAFLDITAQVAFWRAAFALNADAQRAGARILLGAGLIPGIANVIARTAADRVGRVECLNTALLLSLGDVFGLAALDYMLASAGEPFFAIEAGHERMVRNFTDGRNVDFPSPIGRRDVYRFALPEQFFYPHTLDAGYASTRIALDPPWVTSFLSMLARIRITSLLKRSSIRQAVTGLLAGMQRRYRGQETYALKVEAHGSKGVARLGLIGEKESDGTALGAALMARELYEGKISQPGVWLPEQVIETAPFLEKLAARGLLVQEYA